MCRRPNTGVFFVRLYHFVQAQRLAQPLNRVFPFFADARNLEAITPPWLHFRILDPGGVEMRTGAIIDYRLRLHGIPLGWQSRIDEWDPPRRFVDVQTKGPYRMWRHEHRFQEEDGGTVLLDDVTYAIPGPRIVQALFVGPSLQRIFDYRRRRIEEIFEMAGRPGSG